MKKRHTGGTTGLPGSCQQFRLTFSLLSHLRNCRPGSSLNQKGLLLSVERLDKLQLVIVVVIAIVIVIVIEIEIVIVIIMKHTYFWP